MGQYLGVLVQFYSFSNRSAKELWDIDEIEVEAVL